MLDKIYIVCYTYIMRVNPEQTYEKVLRGKYGEVYYLFVHKGDARTAERRRLQEIFSSMEELKKFLLSQEDFNDFSRFEDAESCIFKDEKFPCAFTG